VGQWRLWLSPSQPVGPGTHTCPISPNPEAKELTLSKPHPEGSRNTTPPELMLHLLLVSP
ncbi:hypothetical protein NFI96_019217, partial [Prochilodus magdalenae]